LQVDVVVRHDQIRADEVVLQNTGNELKSKIAHDADTLSRNSSLSIARST
jgi:hypothetical protein